MNEPLVEDLDGVFFGVVARLLGEDFGDGFGDGFGDLVRAGEAAARFFGGISIERGDTCIGARAWRRVEHCEKLNERTNEQPRCGGEKLNHRRHTQRFILGSGTLYTHSSTQSGKHKAAHRARWHTHLNGCQAKGAELGYSKKSLFVCHSCHISA
jgi:hypothetical protein